jgi:hypothetical protein
MARIWVMQTMPFATLAVPPDLRPRTPRQVSSGVLNLDFSHGWPATALGLLYVASRIPWLKLGYGSDPDAWRVAMSAHYLIEHGSYLPSRLPGYPVHDIAMAGLVWGGWTLTNTATLAISLAGVFLFAVLARKLQVPAAGLLTITFAFLPLLWPTSTMTLDYSWALTFFLASYLARLHDRPILAGSLLGLAGGCRISYLAFALPIALLLWQERDIRPVGRFLVATAVVWLLVFSPVWLRYGLQFWNFYDVRPDWGDFVHALTQGSFGLLTSLVLAACLAISLHNLRGIPDRFRADPELTAWALIVLLTAFIYVRLPLQTYYLMPAAPFGLLLLSRALRPAMLIVACVALVCGGFVDIYTSSAAGWRTPGALLGVRPTKGVVLQDYQLRQERLSLVRKVPQLGLPPRSVLTAGFYFPMVVELHRGHLDLTLPDGYLSRVGPLTDNARATGADGVTYVWLLSPGDARDLLRQEYRLFSLDFSRETSTPSALAIYQPENERFGIH